MAVFDSEHLIAMWDLCKLSHQKRFKLILEYLKDSFCWHFRIKYLNRNYQIVVHILVAHNIRRTMTWNWLALNCCHKIPGPLHDPIHLESAVNGNVFIQNIRLLYEICTTWAIEKDSNQFLEDLGLRREKGNWIISISSSLSEKWEICNGVYEIQLTFHLFLILLNGYGRRAHIKPAQQLTVFYFEKWPPTKLIFLSLTSFWSIWFQKIHFLMSGYQSTKWIMKKILCQW